MAKITTYLCDRCGKPIEGETPVHGPTVTLDPDSDDPIVVSLCDLHAKCAATVDDYLRRALLRAHPDDGKGEGDEGEDEIEQRRRLPEDKPQPDDPPVRKGETAEEYARRTAGEDAPAYDGNEPIDPAAPGVDPDGDLVAEMEQTSAEMDDDDQPEHTEDEDPADPPEELFEQGGPIQAPDFAFSIGDQVEAVDEDGEGLFRGEVTARSYSEPVEYEVTPENGKPRSFYAAGLRKVSPDF